MKRNSVATKISLFVCTVALLFSIAGCGENTSFMTEDEMNAYEYVYKNGLTGTITLGFVRDYQETGDVEFEADILFELDYKAAPITVTNFVNLVKSGFYNAPTGEKENPLTMESFDSNYALFGSKKFQVKLDEDGKEVKENGEVQYEYKAVEPEYYIKGEFKNNGWKLNEIAFDKGNVLFMNLTDSAKPDSAYCQFGITTGSMSGDTMKGSYAAFGNVKSLEGTTVYRLDKDGKRVSEEGATFDSLLSEFIQSVDNSERDKVVRIVKITLDGDYDLGATRKLKV